MFSNIRFISGHRAPGWYAYCDTDLFEPYHKDESLEPLRLTDFKDIEVLSRDIRTITIKCIFKDNTEDVAVIDGEMENILQQFLYSARNTPEGQQPEFPIDNPIGYIIIFAAATFYFIYRWIQ